MVLVFIILVLVLGGIAAWSSESKGDAWPRWISLAAFGLDGILVMVLWFQAPASISITDRVWLAEVNVEWIPQIGVGLHLAVDGLSFILLGLAIFLGAVAVICSWEEIRDRTGFFHANLLFTLAGIAGVFMALDLFLFYFFWELMLVPMYFLINIWGHGERTAASFKFFIFTQTGGLFMLLSILALYFLHGRNTGVYTFDYVALLGTSLAPKTAFWIMLGFIFAFIVKLPSIPFHSWAPDAYTSAPTAGSLLLAGLMSKTAGYGFIRFVLPLFPGSTAAVTTAALAIAVISIIYGALLALGQTDLKRLIAYTSISHMGFVLLGIFSPGHTALSGVVILMAAHGISIAALFILTGMIQERTGTRDLNSMGGFWTQAPRLSGMGLAFALATLGLPGFGNFVGEFLVLCGAFRTHPLSAVFAAAGLVLAVVYSLWIVQKAFHGKKNDIPVVDLSGRELSIMAALVVVLVWLGLYPQPMLKTMGPAIANTQSRTTLPIIPAPKGERP